MVSTDSKSTLMEESILGAVTPPDPQLDIASIRFVRRKDVEEIFGVSRSTIYRLMSTGEFPAPVVLPGSGVRWVLSELIEWAQKRIEARDQA